MKDSNKSKRTVKNAVCGMLILIMIVPTLVFFKSISYFCRRVDYNRTNISGFYNERKKSLDVIYVGSSGSFTYWEPLSAYNQYGYTSYVYGTDALLCEFYIPMFEEISKTQNPKLWVIDAKRFFYDISLYDDYEPILRRLVDAWDYSQNRTNLINASVATNERIYYQIDFIKYHTLFFYNLILCLANMNNDSYVNNYYSFSLFNNRPISKTKGFLPKTTQSRIKLNNEVYTDSTPVSAYCDKYMRKTLQYCKEKNMKCLFVITPFSYTKKTKEQCNYISKTINEYGFEVLDTNTSELYNEMSLDGRYDFYNDNHVNILGAEKFTNYFAKYLKSNYPDLPDHRKDSKFSEWDKAAPKFVSAMEKLKKQMKY